MSGLLPKSNMELNKIKVAISPTKTWYVDFEKKRIYGFADGTVAMKQAVELAIKTTRFKYIIYSFNYGQELNQLIGKDFDYVSVEAPRLIKECLLQDDRIKNVLDFNINRCGEGVSITFNVETENGIIDGEARLGV